MKATLPQRVRVGVFEIDLRAGEVRNGEGVIVLPEQPFQILRMLIERSGEMVTRDEIQKRLWPNDTVVEFDHSINAAINKLRQALADSAAAPKYIETIARRGYRLMMVPEPVTDPPVSENGNVSVQPSPGALPLPPSPPKGASLIGKKVSHYRVAKVIGVGGMGLVYEAEDLKLSRPVALKFLPEDLARDEAALQRFEREARAASSLDHPNICTIYEVEEHEGEPFIVMQLLRGENLRDRLAALQAARQRFSVSELLDIAVQVCDGLAAAHAHGVIHRDIKPANIFLTTSGPVKILDFGVAKLMEAGESAERAMAASASPGTASSNAGYLTETGATMGTAGYMSPEQVRGEKLDARTDLFSLGLVLYEMAAGERAFSGETAAVVKDAIQNSAALPLREQNPALPTKLEGIVHRALEKDREQRYQSAAEMRAELLNLAEERKPSRSERSGKSSRWILSAAAVLVCVLGLIAGLQYWRMHRAPKLTDRDTIVIADFDNKTGDPVFDETLRQGLTIQLAQSPYLNILSDRKVRDTLKLMKRPASETLTETVGREVCVRSDSKVIVVGSIAKLNQGYTITLKAVDCTMGGSLAEVQETAADKGAVIKALDRSALALRPKLGESLPSIEKYSTPLSQATTPSLEALKAYSLGSKIERLQGPTAGVPLIQRALELDPNFAMAYYRIGLHYGNLGEGTRSEQALRKAFELRDGVSERERFTIESLYYNNVTRQLEKAAEVYESWHKEYPRDVAPVGNLGTVYAKLGDQDKFLEKSRAAQQLEPNYSLVYANLGSAYMNLNRLDGTEEAFKEAERRGLAAELLVQYRYQLGFLKGDKAMMAQMVAASRDKPGTEDILLASEADTAAWYGQFKSAGKLTEQAVDSAKRNDARETAGIYMAEAALREAAAGNREQAVKDAKLALNLSQHRDVTAIAALSLAQAGDTTAAQTLAAGLNDDSPLDTQVQLYWLPAINAAIGLERKDTQSAVRRLADIGNLDFATFSSMVDVFLCPVYVRGNAYLQQGNGPAAAAEFQKFIDHYGLLTNFPWGALARLGLARAYALEAETDPSALDKARTAYENFLTLWKDADPDIPIYRQAKAEFAKLNRQYPLHSASLR
jgi:serine/threonine protein kinase